ncbi:MAG TPA: hypothetical protein P5513_04365, partial [Candidatus Diapherotrites archaeon]|nr:hypothetical protein [Candidatus Diapherotrites archaeon]
MACFQKILLPNGEVIEFQNEAELQAYVKENFKNLQDLVSQEMSEDFEYGDLTPELVQQILQSRIGIEGLSPIEEFTVAYSIYIELSEKLKEEGKVDKTKVFNDIKLKILTKLQDKKNHNTEQLLSWKDIDTEGITKEKQKRVAENKKIDTVINNIDTLIQNGYEILQKYTRAEEVFEQDEMHQTEKSYNATNLEEKGKKHGSYFLKRFYSGIQDRLPNGELKTGFLGFPIYVGFDRIDDTIKTLLTAPNETEANFATMIEVLEENADTKTWLPDLIDKLKKAEGQVQNAFVSENRRHNLSSKFVMFQKNMDGTYSLKVYDTNANEIKRVLKNTWEENSLNLPSHLIYWDKETMNYKVNAQMAKVLWNKYKHLAANNWNGKYTPSVAELVLFLKEFGIDASEATVNSLMINPGYMDVNGRKVRRNYKSLFELGNNNGLYGGLLNFLNKMAQKTENPTILEDKTNHPFTNLSSYLNEFISIEQKYTKHTTTISFRDGGKSIYAKPLPNAATDIANKLVNNQAFRQLFLNKAFNKQSMFLNLLENDEKFRSFFGVDYLANTALKEYGNNFTADSEITQLSEIDREIVRLGGLTDTKQGDIRLNLQDFPLLQGRLGRMFFPTMSDKSQMFFLKTVLIDMQKDLLNEDKDLLRDDVLELLYSQLVEPELNRIIEFSKKGKSNISDYDGVAGLFLMLPGINEIMIGDVNVAQYLNVNKDYNANVQNFLNNTIDGVPIIDIFKQKAKAYINDLIVFKAKNKALMYEDLFYTKDENGNEIVKIIDNRYLSTRKNVNSKKEAIEILAFDMVINNLLSMANMVMLFSGDMAFYAQEKHLNTFFNNGDVSSPKVENAYTQFAASAGLDINYGKRLALLLAPRKKLNNDNIDKYYQVFLKDFKDITNNFSEIVKIHYGDDEARIAAKLVEEYNNAESPVLREEKITELSQRYPSISDFLSLTATDAQEYTTVREHVEILYRQGYMTEQMYNTIDAKLNARKGKDTISKEDFLSFEELKVVLTPIKPVYTGLINDEDNGVMRPIYIKSSSFPLLPELTLDTELDNLRVAMEKLEEKSGKRVRASYQTANKVGSLKNPISIFNSQGEGLPLTAEHLEAASLLLDRDNFGIQQDVPPKFLKGMEKTAIGTQLLKLSFGNGVVNLPGFDKLQQKFNADFVELINIKKQNLFKELGLSPTGQIENLENTLEKIQSVLLEEAKKRDYPLQSIEALNTVALVNIEIGGVPLTADGFSKALDSKQIKFIRELHEGVIEATLETELKLRQILDNENISQEEFKNGELKINFKDVNFSLPLWLTPDSNKFESLLNSMFSKRLIEIKLPGNSFVVGSEAGLKLKVKDNYTGKVIFTSKYNGELQARTTEGKTQIFLPLRFRDNKGDIISFFDAQGNPNTTYVNVAEDGKLTLKEDMIDQELLSSITFRIPTSGLISASAVEVVGILPIEVGDLMIVPKALTAQKGLDFDVDKENMYYLHHYVDANNKIKVLTDPEYSPEEWIEVEEDFKALREKYKAKKGGERKLKALEEKINQGVDLMSFEEYKKILKDKAFYEKKLAENTFTDEDFLAVEIAYKNITDKNFRTKILENEIVKMHQKILYSNNPELLKKVNRVLSMDNAKNNKKLVQDALNKKKNFKYFTSLDGDHQNSKMELGAVGKLGISIYSNAVTFNGLSEQMKNKVQLYTFEMNEKSKMVRVPYITRIGSYVSDGKLGKISTFDGKRSIPEILEERQNTATDNEKEQIMGALNINEQTIGVDIMMALLGFDMDTFTMGDKTIEVNLSYMLISQPIIRDFVAQMKKSKSKMYPFSTNTERNVIEKLLSSFGELANSKPDYTLLTGYNLYDELLKDVPTPAIQYAALMKFLELKKMYNNLSQSISRFNINSSKLGISFFEVIDKYDYIANTLGLESYADNLEDMIGEIVDTYEFDAYGPELERQHLEMGLMPFYGKNKVRVFKATTPVGALFLNSVHSAYNTWSSFFPYDTLSFKNIVEQIKGSLSSQELSVSKNIEINQKIFQEFKKYLVTRNSFNIIKNPVTERYNLMVDDFSKGKISLATYLRSLKNINPSLFNNPILMNLEFKTNIGGLSKISFNNAKQEDFDESMLYNSFLDLLSNVQKLPKFNGQNYSTVTLVQDLIKYSYLEGGIQEATQFVKYVPITYLNTLGFGLEAISTQKGMDNTDISKASSIQLFIKQFFQNNPQMATALSSDKKELGEKIDIISGDLKDLQNLNSFKLKNGVVMGDYVRIYNPYIQKGYKKYQLYQKDSSGVYHRIGLLGYDTISEYSFGIDNRSLVEKNFPTISKPAVVVQQNNTSGTQTLPFALTEKTGLINVVENVLASNIESSHKELIKFLYDNGFIDNIDVYLSELNGAEGIFDPTSNTISLDSNFVKSNTPEKIIKVLSKEIVHAATAMEMKKYFDISTGMKLPGVELTSAMSELFLLFNTAKASVPKEEVERVKRLISKNQAISYDDKIKYYPFTNIFEFVEMIFTEPQFQERMNRLPYAATNKSIIEKLFDIFKKMFGMLDTDKVAFNALQASFKVMNEQKQSKKRNLEQEAAKYLSENTLTENENLKFPEIQVIKPGVSELFESNPELAN